MKIIKALILIILIILIGSIAVFSAISVNKTDSLSEKDYQIRFNQYGISFYNSDQSKEIFKVSPFDDFYYSKDTKDHLSYPATFSKGVEDNNSLGNTIRTLIIRQKSLRWKAENKNGLSITYEITNQANNIVRISRHINGTKMEIQAIGQSVVLCKDCLVTDQNKRVFFSSKENFEDKLNLIKNIQLSPVIITNNLLPNSISKLVIIDSSFNTKLVLFIQPNQQIFYDAKWNLIEIKTPIINKNNLTVEQMLSFKNAD